ncbi:MAG TPA: hypothetical protein VN256_24965 [Pyrinomonadaceae bacterium]|nr:hypothetical protein [Pyrinomonadaceae bacterium]
MEEIEQKLRHAKIMRRSADPKQRARGEERLREVIREAEGTIYAKAARDLLNTDKPAVPELVDPELDELMLLWPSIMGFNDHRLANFLRRLEDYPGMAAPLRTEVIQELRLWIARALPDVRPGAQSKQIAALNDFVAAVRGVAAYEALPEFGQLRDGLFHLRLQETTASVDAALKVWALDEAQRLLDELAPLPDSFKPSVEQLQKDVYEVVRLRRTVESFLRQVPEAAPANWSEMRLQVELLQKLEEYLPHTRVPKEWRSRLGDARERLSKFVEQFVRAQALVAVTTQQLRDFRAEFDRLPAGFAAGHWQVGEDWFQRGIEAVSVQARTNVERARHPNELTAISNRLRADMEGVPPAVAAHMGKTAEAISKHAAAWKAMQEGQAFELPAAESGAPPAPEAWRDEAERYAAWLQRIEEALNTFRGATPPPSEQVYQEGLLLAEEILAQAPKHALAQKLRLESTRRISCYQLDRALTNWRLEAFFELIEANNPGEIYAALVAEKEVLFELRALARRGPLTDWRSAAQWWADWQAASKRLPSAKPDALLEALAQQEARRQQEWYAALDRLLQDSLTPEEYEGAASSLDGEAGTSLLTYQQELQRKAIIGRIEQHIRSARLAEAERELNQELPPESTDASRLRTQLKIAQARGRGSAEAAEYLSSDWENVKSYLDHPQRVLLETIEAVWAEGRQEWVDKLAQLIPRALAREEKGDATTRELAEWQTWLEIEDGLLDSFSSGAVKQLADYLRNVEPGPLLDQRLKKLLLHWQAENNTVMLAWAYQAFQRKSSAAEQFYQAADRLAEESDQVAERALGAMAEREFLEPGGLNPLHESLQREEERWRLLSDFLSLHIPHPVKHRQPSQKFARAKLSVAELTRILTSLARLKEADLRQDEARQDFEDAYARARRLDGVAVRAQILKDLDRLRPLQEDLFSLGQRIRETAERCRSREALDVLEPGLFEQMAEYVRKVVETFSKAEATGGTMWQLVSSEYEEMVYREACVLLPASGLPRLDQLAATLDALHAEEVAFTHALAQLEDRDRQPKVPWGGTFDPEPHLDYLRLIPAQAPRSLKLYHRFDRARRDTLKLILEARASRPHLPEWVREYLDKGVPACANER